MNATINSGSDKICCDSTTIYCIRNDDCAKSTTNRKLHEHSILSVKILCGTFLSNAKCTQANYASTHCVSRTDTLTKNNLSCLSFVYIGEWRINYKCRCCCFSFFLSFSSVQFLLCCSAVISVVLLKTRRRFLANIIYSRFVS